MPKRIPSRVDLKTLLIAEQKYLAHRQELAAAGHDPDMIGCTEVKPPCCPGCGKAIPWATLQRYR